MLTRLLSNDYPRSRILAVVLVLLFLALAFTPFLFPGVKALNVAAKVLVFIVLVASFDLLLGYTGIVSFAHTMFFGIGAYGIAIASTRMGAGWTRAAGRHAGALALSFVLALAIGLFSLRVRAIFFSMITLAFAAAFQTLASQLSDFTGGEDGLTFKMPECCRPASSFPKLLPRRLARRPAALLLPAVRRAVVLFLACCASSTRRSAACCRRSARTSSAPRPSATAWWCTARCPASCRRCSPRWPARCWRSGCATTGRTPRCPSRSCWTCC
jgi:ABC-type branched-subunit amino acid transport system permease subunit